MSLTLKRRVTVLATVISVMLISSVVFAAWTANGTGNGTAAAGQAEDVTLTSEPVGALVPNTSTDLKVTFTNPNPYDVVVTAITNGTGGIDSSVAACDLAHGVSFDEATGLNVRVPADTSNTVVTLEDALSMSYASDNACQSATFTVPLAFTAASSAPSN